MGQSNSSIIFQRELIPAKAGVGLRTQHMAHFASGAANISWVEIHAENYFCEGGPRLDALFAAREHYPISVHGVGLSLGTAEGVSKTHLKKLKKLCDTICPGLISEHLSWSVSGGAYLNDLLPLPLNEESFNVFVNNINETQN
ncbi:multinuclear nonheme iron-dependent oxidase, partial [Curvivirga aplysinae]|uniref:multinuclear nonheme iron-dependent oxidase n=1 Tax=Curvivirga aplysinae TaxID=2529852 RepID=UPI0012BD0744